MIDFELLLNNN